MLWCGRSISPQKICIEFSAIAPPTAAGKRARACDRPRPGFALDAWRVVEAGLVPPDRNGSAATRYSEARRKIGARCRNTFNAGLMGERMESNRGAKAGELLGGADRAQGGSRQLRSTRLQHSWPASSCAMILLAPGAFTPLEQPP